jgi:hypothetical protein
MGRTTSNTSSSSSSSSGSEGAREGAIHSRLQQEATVVQQSNREVDRALRDIDRQEVEINRLTPVTGTSNSKASIPSAATGMMGTTAVAMPVVSHGGADRDRVFDQGVDRGVTKEVAREERKAEKMDRREDKAAAQVSKHAEKREAAEEHVQAAAARVSAAEQQLEGTHSNRGMHMPATGSSSSSYTAGATGGLPLGVTGPAMGEGYAPVVAPVTIAGEAPGPEMSRPAGVAPTLLAAPAAVGLGDTSRGHLVTPGHSAGDDRDVRKEEKRAEKEVRREEKRAEKELRRAEKELNKAERQAGKHVSVVLGCVRGWSMDHMGRWGGGSA